MASCEKARSHFFFEKTGCLLEMLRKQKARSTHKIATVDLTTGCSNFFATPTRLAAGLGTKDYPRGFTASPHRRWNLCRPRLVPPRPSIYRTASVINFSTIIRYHRVEKGFKKNHSNLLKNSKKCPTCVPPFARHPVCAKSTRIVRSVSTLAADPRTNFTWPDIGDRASRTQ